MDNQKHKDIDGRERIVLIVEDDNSLRYLTERQLNRLGFACEFAVDGAEAVEKWLLHKYVFILMDVQMPRMNGLEAATEIRRLEASAHSEDAIPIVAMTANPNRQRCYDAGMNDFMFKPVLLEDIKRIVLRWAPAA